MFDDISRKREIACLLYPRTVPRTYNLQEKKNNKKRKSERKRKEREREIR